MKAHSFGCDLGICRSGSLPSSIINNTMPVD